MQLRARRDAVKTHSARFEKRPAVSEVPSEVPAFEPRYIWLWELSDPVVGRCAVS
jgi:hypothetical protein